ncbi:MAG: hypothetical protein K2W85_16075 [Phycisphaerales bacterium]|nr:hypothetical protein [Phycisphaerales bacterium]
MDIWDLKRSKPAVQQRAFNPRSVLGVCALMGCAALASRVHALPPANDVCSTSGAGGTTFVIPPSGGMLVGDLTDATRDTIDVSCVGALGGVDVYYTLTPVSSGVYQIETCGSSFDTVLTVHTGCPTAGANQVPGACNDDFCGLQSQVATYLAAGQTYVVRVGTYDGSTAPGPFVMNVTFTPAPANDACGTGVPLLSLNVPVSSSNAGAGSDITVSPSTLCGTFTGSGGGADVWYRFKPPTTGAYALTTCGGGLLDTVLSIHANCPQAGNDLITCNDDMGLSLCPSNRFASKVTAALIGGTTYFVRVAGYRTGGVNGASATGPFTLLATTAPDDFGACCDSALGCTVTLATQCPGTYVGNSTVCLPTSCSTGTGVCCIGTVCKLTTSGECAPRAGDNVGAVFNTGTQCNPSGNRVMPCCHADFDKDGQTTVQDVFAYLNAWFASNPYAVVEGDGVQLPVVQDIFNYLNLWFAGGC